MNCEIQNSKPLTWSSEPALKERMKTRTSWEIDLNKNYQSFADELSQAIASKVFINFQTVLEDASLQQPNLEMPLKNKFSLQITNSKTALELKELAPNSIQLAPFDEWINRFASRDQKIGKEESLFNSSSTIKFVGNKNTNGIDGEYFQDRMAIIGLEVENKLKTIFAESSKLNEKFQVIWYQKSSQMFSTSSNFSEDNCINVNMWIENSKNDKNLQIIDSVANKAIIEQKQKRENKKNLQRVGIVAFIVVVISVLFMSKFITLSINTRDKG